MPPSAESLVTLRPHLPSPVYLAYGSSDLNDALALLQIARARFPEVELRDYTVRISFTGAAAGAVRELILQRMQDCRGMICIVGRPELPDQWPTWMLTHARKQGWPCSLLFAGVGSTRPASFPYEGLPMARSLSQALRALNLAE